MSPANPDSLADYLHTVVTAIPESTSYCLDLALHEVLELWLAQRADEGLGCELLILQPRMWHIASVDGCINVEISRDISILQSDTHVVSSRHELFCSVF